MDLFVINLERSPERLKEFQRVNNHLKNVNRFAAIEGNSLSHNELIKRKFFEEPILYSNGAIGNALSHLALWEQAAQKSSPTTIFEDDAIIHKNFETIAPELLASLPQGWDIALWGWNFDSVLSFDVFPGTSCVVHFSQNEMRQRWEGIQSEPVKPSMHRLHYSFGSVGYSISPEGAKRLVSMALPIKPFLSRIPAFNLEVQNNAMDCVLASLSKRLNMYVSFPPLVLTKNERAGSSVQQNNQPEDNEKDFRLLASAEYYESRKYKKKYARYLFKKGNVGRGLSWYLKSLTARK